MPDPAYDLLKSVVRISNALLSLPVKLDQMLQSISKAFQSGRCLFLGPEKIIPNGFLYRLALEKKPLWVEEGSPFRKENAFPEEEDLLCPAFACVPLYDETSLLGILYLGFPKHYTFSPQERDLFLLVGQVMERAIRNDDLRQKADEITSELTACYEIGKAATSPLKLENLFELIASTGLRILKAKGGVLRVEDRKSRELKVKFSVGGYHQNSLDEKMARRAFNTQTPLSFNHSGQEKSSFSAICAPFLSKGKALGTLAFYDKDSRSAKFDDKDLQRLLIMANQLSSAIENALIQDETSEMVQRHEQRVKELSTLWELNKALLTTVNFERILHLTLTAITIGEGLKFNRAMLFLVNEKDRILEGTMAVGPDNAEEAGKVWASLSRRNGALSDLITQLDPEDHSILNSIVKGIQIPLEQEQCILSRTVLEGRPFNTQLPQSKEGWLQTRCERGCHLGSEVGCYVGEHLSRDPRIYSFATVPLMGKGKVIGVVLVDNLYNQNPITEEDIQFLSMFANQAGLAIENAALYRNLEEVHQELKETQTFLVHLEKMVALGEMSTTIAHEIKNPLTSIGGFARRLDRTLPKESQEKKYSQTIIKEVSRLEKILNDLLNYTRDGSLVFKELDLRDVLEESLSMVIEGIRSGGVQVIKEYEEKIPLIKGDFYELKQSFFNLINNACQAMKERGTLFLRVHSFSKNGLPCVRVEVEDTGKGIDPENLHNIFNPFYSTKESSLGLGLPIVHKIIASHRGQIEVDNRPGTGVKFIITLPAFEEGKENSINSP
ncbi:MAG TPA: GAF domain-containing protein [Thermodesulfobacteriota bacterium]|jgi:signal transduction histidine kinase|nr:GAF domain-containing protein [Thermodesulfobacteriota bacterium]